MASIERERVPSPRPIAAKEIPLIDRVEEMTLLKEAVDRAILGGGSLVFLYGEAGIGKTRMARELRAYAHLRGMQVLYGRCPALFRMDGVPPYILWREVIRDYLENCSPEQLYRVVGFYPAEIAKLVPELGQKLRGIPQSFQINPEQEQNRLFEAVSQFITNISRDTPLLVVLDDLQWTDPSSLLLLHYMARGGQRTSLLLLGAYRSTDIDVKHPLSPVLTELNRERLPQSIQLKRMPLNDVSEMIKSILEQDDVPAEFCKLVYEKTRGNPFFAEEVIKSLKEEDVIYREEEKWKFKEISKIEFPETVKNVVKARISRLDEDCQNVLTLASFVGNDFTLEAICALTGIEENKLLELMDKMLKKGLIKEREIRGEGVCSFAVTVLVNGLAGGTTILGGKSTAEISDTNPTLITPAGYVFSIWGIIYILLGIFVIFQALPVEKGKEYHGKIGWLFVLSSLLNIAWLFLWQFEYLSLSVVLMFLLLASLISIYLRLNIGKSSVPLREKLAVHVPFSVYLGWITIASIANVSVALVSAGWDGFGISQEIWAALIIVIALVITLLVIATRKDAAYGLVIIWALAGIAVKQSGYSNIVMLAETGAIITVIALAASILLSRSGHK